MHHRALRRPSPTHAPCAPTRTLTPASCASAYPKIDGQFADPGPDAQIRPALQSLFQRASDKVES